LACRSALTCRGVAHITFPTDFQTMNLRKGAASERNVHPEKYTAVYATQAGVSSDQDLKRAADVLNDGEKVAILAGGGALGATEELLALAEKLGAPIIKALLGKACVPDDSPYTTGTIGLLGTRPSQEAIEECDTLFMVGTSFPYLEFLPKKGQARVLQPDFYPMPIGLSYPI